MRFSVIIPVYNVLPYLDTCVKSILSQSYPHFEMLLIDDGSTDKSGEACDRWAQADDRVRVVHQQNKGLAAARNTGIRLAVGEYLLFLDSDDYWHAQDGLAALDATLKKQEQPLDVILFGYCKINLKTGKETPYRLDSMLPQKNAYARKQELLAKRQYSNSACTKLVRRAFLQKYQIAFPSGRKSEDLVYSRQILTEMQSFSVCPDTILTYQTGRKGSISTAFGRQNYCDILEQLNADLTALEDAPPEEKALGRAYWAEQGCWFLGYLPMSGKPLRQTIRECQKAFEVLPDGLSRRTCIVQRLVGLIGKNAAVRLLNLYLRSRIG